MTRPLEKVNENSVNMLKKKKIKVEKLTTTVNSDFYYIV